MLGRLEMDVNECILAYNEIMKTVFSEKSNWQSTDWKGRTKATQRLESAIKAIITRCGVPETALFDDGVDHRCKV